MKRKLTRGFLALLSAIAFLSGGFAYGQEQPVAEPATLVVWNRTLAIFRAPVGGIPPAQRVENSRQRIAALPRGSEHAEITTHPGRVGTDEGLAIAVGGTVIFGLVPGDLDPESDQTLNEAASESARRVGELLNARAAQRDVRGALRGAAYSLLALIVFLVAMRLILKVRNAFVGRLSRLFSNRKISIGGIDILPTLETVERATFRVLSWALILSLAYLSLTFIFNQFPYTAPLGERLGDWLVEKLTGAGRAIALSLPSLVGVVAVLLVTRAISLWVSRMLVEVEHGLREVAWLAQEQAKATRRIASGLIWVLGIATAYPLLPWSDSKAFQGMSVVLGLAVSFASGGLINHWVSGLMVLYARSFRVGEFVAIGETEGIVTEMGALATKLRTMRREEVTIPNGVMASDKLVNYTRLAAERGALLSTAIAIGYGVTSLQVRELLTAAAAATQGVAPDPAPRVLAWQLEDFYVRYQLHVHLLHDTDRVAVRAALNERILEAFGAAGVQIMTPHFESQPEQPLIARATRAPA